MGIRTLSPFRRFRQGPSYSPNRLVSQSATLKDDLYKAVEGPSTSPIVLSMITGSYFRRRRRLTILEPDKTKCASHLTLLFCRLDHCRGPGERFLPKHSCNHISQNLDKRSEHRHGITMIYNRWNHSKVQPKKPPPSVI